MDKRLYAEVIDGIGELHTERIQKRMNLLGELVPAIQENFQRNRERNRANSYQLNVFRFFEPGETTHSRLLAYFLDPNETHGQSNVFLVEFLRLLKIAKPDKGRWIVTAEKGRIDVLLKRKDPHSVVIVENKSNYATDQSNQLYRYWYQEIYKQQKEHSVSKQLIENPPDTHYQIIYLAPAHWKQPGKQSLQKPAALKHELELPEWVPQNLVKHRLFSDFVVEWLTYCLDKLPESNYRLNEFVKQYIEHWQLA